MDYKFLSDLGSPDSFVRRRTQSCAQLRQILSDDLPSPVIENAPVAAGQLWLPRVTMVAAGMLVRPY